MLINDQKRQGFTIVELVIVIAVIGILSAIIVPTYNGMQQRARNATRMDIARQYTDILRMSLIKNSPTAMIATMDHTDGWDRACLGTGYPDIDGDGRGDCATWLNSPYVSDTSTFNTMLEKTALPSMAKYPVLESTHGMALYGQYASEATIDGEVMVTLEYSLEGDNQDCVFRPLVYRNGSSTFSMTPWGDPRYTISGNGVTECRLAVSRDR